MRQGDHFAFPGEDDGVVADDRAAAQRRKADAATRPRSGVPVANPDGIVGKINPAPVGGRLAEQHRCA